MINYIKITMNCLSMGPIKFWLGVSITKTIIKLCYSFEKY